MVEMCGEIVQQPRKKEHFIDRINNLVDISQKQNKEKETIMHENETSKRKVTFVQEVKETSLTEQQQQNDQMENENKNNENNNRFLEWVDKRNPTGMNASKKQRNE